MLFRLRMSIDDAISAFVNLSNSVFSEKNIWSRRSSRLEDGIVGIIQNAVEGQAKELRMMDEGGPKWSVPLLYFHPTDSSPQFCLCYYAAGHVLSNSLSLMDTLCEPNVQLHNY